MWKCLLIMLCIYFFSRITCNFDESKDFMTLTILYDNYIFDKDLKSDWGFSCFIKGTEKTILFDTGTKGELLLDNITKLKIDPKDAELIVLSHIHNDHTGGLLSFLEKNDNVSVYIPESFPANFVKSIKQMKAQVIPVDKPVEICKNVFLTGEMGSRVIEQSLVVNTDRGMIVITGCAHPGIVEILKKAKEIIDNDIYLVLGGFHLLEKSEKEIQEIIKKFKKLGVQRVGATHCTGDKAISLFKRAFGDNYVQMGVGKVVRISK